MPFTVTSYPNGVPNDIDVKVIDGEAEAYAYAAAEALKGRTVFLLDTEGGRW